MESQEPWALVTGASSGIGHDIAVELASRGWNCVLVARRRDRLEEIAARLVDVHRVQAEVEEVDLAAPGNVAALHSRLGERGRRIDLLVNNAGFALFGDFIDMDPGRVEEMLRLNVVALTELTLRFGGEMAARGAGHVMNVASIAGLNPLPSYAAYAATKAFVVSLGEAIGLELASRGVKVTTVMPGVTRTEFFEVSGQEESLYNRITGMKSEDVAQIAVNATLRGKPSVITGWRNRVAIGAASLLPRRAAAWLTWQMMKRG